LEIKIKIVLAAFDSFYIMSSEQFHKEMVYDEVNGRQV